MIKFGTCARAEPQIFLFFLISEQSGSHLEGENKMNFDAMGLFVDDVATMVKFYEEMLEMAPEWDGGPAHADMLNKQGFRLMLSSRQFVTELLREEVARAKINRTMELAFLVDSHAAVDEKFAQFKTAGVTLISEPATMPWGQRNFYFTDPEGNLCEIFAN
jgi:catechol 2,3-dioxygenase-like lactoylglutathione lyase family enzyme